MKRADKKRRKVQVPPPAIKIYFVGNGDMREQILNDAKRFGVSVSALANMYIRAGRPTVVKSLEKAVPEQVN